MTAHQLTGEERLQNAIEVFLGDKRYPCAGAKSAMSQATIASRLATSMRCPADDAKIIESIYEFIAEWQANPQPFASLIVAFEKDGYADEKSFENAMWSLLQRLHEIDRDNFEWDPTVSSDPDSPDFSFSSRGKSLLYCWHAPPIIS